MIEVLVKSDFVEGARRVDLNWTVSELAKKLEPVTGIPPESQNIEFYKDSDVRLSVHQASSDATLESLGLFEQCKIVVIDTRNDQDKLKLDESVPHYVISDKDYEAKSGTLLEWKRQNKLGRFAEHSGTFEQATLSADVHSGQPSVPLNNECYVHLSWGQTVKGTVSFIGEIPDESGIWVGVNLVTASGKNNGTIKGIKFFVAETNHGVFVRPNAVRPLNDDEEEL